jgi:BASS family bile acid:Na+ symporter
MTPEFVAFVNSVFVPVGLMLIMFSMGLTLVLRDFGLVLTHPRMVIVGLGGQLIMLPILGLLIGTLFRLSPELALGLFIISICPAGTTSNALTFVGRGNVALAVVLTALSSMVTVFSIPLLLSWAIPFFLTDGGADIPTLSVPGTILQLLQLTAAPIAAGMLVRHFAPDKAGRMATWLRPTSLIVLVGVIAFSVAVSLEMVLLNLVAAGPAIWTLNVAAIAVGIGLARALGADRRDSMTIGIEVGVQNATMAIFLTLTVLGSLPLAVTQNIYGVVMILNAFLLIRWFRRRLDRNGAGGRP